MPERIFVDTNVFVYALDGGAGAKQVRSRDLLTPTADRTLVWSAQVLAELSHVALRKLSIAPDSVGQIVRRLTPGVRVHTDAELVAAAIDLADRFSFWDGLIIAAARRAECTVLLTEDLNAGEIVEGIRVTNPFADL